MKKYHKIQTLFKREKNGKIIIDKYSRPEFEYLYNNIWDLEEKVDGMNIRVIFDGEKIRFNGKTDNAQLPVPLFEKLIEFFPVEKFKDYPPMCLYGEGYGVKIQSGGKYISDGVSFVLFDIKISDFWLERSNKEDIASKLGINIVPIVKSGTLANMLDLCERGFISAWGDFEAEGIVAKPQIPLFNKKGNRIITKLKCKDFK